MKLARDLAIMVCCGVTLAVALSLTPRVFGFSPPDTPNSQLPVQAYHWHTSLATFYDFNTWGWNRPGGRNGIFACGGKYLRNTIGVAHRTLPCGTEVRICHDGLCVNAPVRDRFYGSGFDMTSETCLRIKACHTGLVKWRVP